MVKGADPSKMGEDLGSESSDRPLFNRKKKLVLGRQSLDECGVQRLGEPSVRDGGGQTSPHKLLGGFEALKQSPPVRQKGDPRAFAQDPSAAYFERPSLLRQNDAMAFATRVTEGDWTFIVCRRRRDHVNE